MWFRRTDHRPWRAAEFLAVDFETTSADPRAAEPLSVGWVVVADGRVRLREAGYRLVAHNGHLPAASLPVHGLLPHELALGEPLTEVADAVRTVAADRIVVAHGAWIERALLGRLEVNHRGLIDTMAVVRRLDEREGHRRDGRSLAATTTRFGVPQQRAHHAFGDALTTAMLLVVLATRLERVRDGCPVDDLLRLGRL
jgi:DNA polymerase-3 subunit epsilon